MKIKIKKKTYNWNGKAYGNLKESIKVYLDGEEKEYTPNEWDKILKKNNLTSEMLEVENIVTNIHSKFNQFLKLFGDFKINNETQKRELKILLERLTNKIQDRQLMLALDIFIKVNYDD